MIRLAIRGTAEGTHRDISNRLRNALVTSFNTERINFESTNDCDAVAFVGPVIAELNEVTRSLASRKHVLVTADTTDLREHMDEWTRVALHAGVQLFAVNTDHWLPSRQLIQQQISSGKLGDVGLVRIHRWESTSSHQLRSQSRLPLPLVSDLELAVWLFDGFPDTVYAVESAASQTEHDAPQGRFIQAHLGFPGGGMALITYSTRLPEGAGYQSLSVIGSSGAAYADDHQDRQLVFTGGAPQAVRGGEGMTLGLVLQEFIDAMRDDRDLSTNLLRWNRVWELAVAVENSILSRRAMHPRGVLTP